MKTYRLEISTKYEIGGMTDEQIDKLILGLVYAGYKVWQDYDNNICIHVTDDELTKVNEN